MPDDDVLSHAEPMPDAPFYVLRFGERLTPEEYRVLSDAWRERMPGRQLLVVDTSDTTAETLDAAAERAWRSYGGRDAYPWAKLDEQIKDEWRDVARAVLDVT